MTRESKERERNEKFNDSNGCLYTGRNNSGKSDRSYYEYDHAYCSTGSIWSDLNRNGYLRGITL